MIEKICFLVAFYEGGLGYTEARKLPLPELLLLQRTAEKIDGERERAIERARCG